MLADLLSGKCKLRMCLDIILCEDGIFQKLYDTIKKNLRFKDTSIHSRIFFCSNIVLGVGLTALPA